ncbi:hypothetical protein FSP39_022481 [Pinctada imbricata]|uniref:Uncharacterized protein n=1 Tax=Pinctada imbricata TaxID=66713 RepID=A0AA88XJY4_PINIB|nr:hypothetical protein FSP39_022481 [Pinctada imbricata]
MTKFASIEEIRSECHAIVEEIGGYLFIPPLVFINFLLVLSYTRLGENDRRHGVMFELTQLLCHDDGSHVFRIHKAISWEILGICQELCGGHHAALHSYVKALHDRHNFFKQATLARIACSTYGIWVRRNVI